MEAVSGPGAGGGTAIASLGRRGRGDADADSMGYDEVRAVLLSFVDDDGKGGMTRLVLYCYRTLTPTVTGCDTKFVLLGFRKAWYHHSQSQTEIIFWLIYQQSISGRYDAHISTVNMLSTR